MVGGMQGQVNESRGGWRYLKRVIGDHGRDVTGCPPYRPGRALISASGSYLG
jgi:hypothetical protein